MQKKRKILIVLDSASILNSSSPLQLNKVVHIPLSVVNEFISFRGEHQWIVFKETNHVVIDELMSEEIKQLTRKLPRKLNEKLSQVDKEVLALAVRLKKDTTLPIVLTDDYALQKACYSFHIPCQGIMFKEIREQQRLKERLKLDPIINQET